MLEINSLSDDLEKKIPSQAKTSQQHDLIITRMSSGVRDQNRANIYINGKFAFSLDIKQVVDLQIKIGKKLTRQELQELHSASEFGKLYQRALEWALTRPRSVWETRDYLKRRQLKRAQLNKKRAHDELKPMPEIQSETIDLVIDRLAARNYVNDRTFAEYYVENRFTKKGISQKRLILELHKKHIDESIIQEVLTNSSRDEDAELAKMIAKKKRKYDSQKLIQYLIGQGFDYQKVKDAVARLADEGEGKDEYTESVSNEV